MENKTIKLLNSNLEIALRLLVIMNVHKKTIERDRLVAYEYFVIHSGDIKNAPSSIHPDIHIEQVFTLAIIKTYPML